MKQEPFNSIDSRKEWRLGVIALAFLLLSCFGLTRGVAQVKNQKRVTSVRLGTASEGSRVTVVSDKALNDYEAYRRGDRFYVKLPAAEYTSAHPGFRGTGFEDVQVQKGGDGVIISFRLQPGTTARVDQRLNKLDVVFSTPGRSLNNAGSSTVASRLASAATSGIGTARTNASNAGSLPPSSVGKYRDSLERSYPGQSRTTGSNTSAAGPTQNDPQNRSGVAGNNRSAGQGTTSSLQAGAATPDTPGGTAANSDPPTSSATGTPESLLAPVTQSQPSQRSEQPATTPSGVASPQSPPAPGGSAARWLSRNWYVPSIGLLLLGILAFLIITYRRPTQIRIRRTRRSKELLAQPKSAGEASFAELAFVALADHPAVPRVAEVETRREAELSLEPLRAAPFSSETSRTQKLETTPPKSVSHSLEAKPLIAEQPLSITPVPFDRIDTELKKLLAGLEYDASVINPADATTRQMIGAQLLAALGDPSGEEHERARRAFLNHGYFDEATRDLRTADSSADRAAAAGKLGRIGMSQGTAHLIAALYDSAPEVRRAAVESLGQVRDPTAISALNDLLLRETNRQLPETAIRQAIKSITVAAVRPTERQTPRSAEPRYDNPVLQAYERESFQEVVESKPSQPAKPREETTKLKSLTPAPGSPSGQSAGGGGTTVPQPQATVKSGPDAEEAQLLLEEEALLRAAEELERRRLEAEKARKNAEKETRREVENEARIRAEAEARVQAEEEARRQAELEAARRKLEEEARVRTEREVRERTEKQTRLRAEEEARFRLEAETLRKAAQELARRRAEAQSARRFAAEEAHLRAEEETRRQQVEDEIGRRTEEQARRLTEEEARKRAEEQRLQQDAEERRRVAAERLKLEQETLMQAAAELTRRRAEVEEARKRAEEESRLLQQARERIQAEDERRRQAEEERQRLEAETLSRAEEERQRLEESRRRAEEEQQRLAEQSRLRAAEEEQRLAELELLRRQAEQQARQRAEQEQRIRSEIEALRQAEVEQKKRIEAETRRRAEAEARLNEEEVRHQAEGAARLKVEEEARGLAEETRRRAAEEGSRRSAAEARLTEEDARLRTGEETQLQAELEAGRRTGAEARLKEEQTRLRAEEEARLQAEEETRRLAEDARLRTEEEIRRRAEAEARFGEEEARRQTEEARLKAEEKTHVLAEEGRLRTAQDAKRAFTTEPAQGEVGPKSKVEPWINVDHQERAEKLEKDESIASNLVAKETADAPRQPQEPAKGVEVVHWEKGIEQLGVDKDSGIPSDILRRLSSNVSGERTTALIELGQLGGDDAFSIVSRAFDDESVDVRSAAAHALYNLQSDRAASFTRALREGSPERRRSIGAALATSGLANEAIGNLTGESREKTYDAFSLLFLMAKAGEVHPLLQAIEDHPNIDVRLAVVKLLALSGQAEIVPAFRRLAVRGSLPSEVRSAVMEAIYQISSQARESAPSAA